MLEESPVADPLGLRTGGSRGCVRLLGEAFETRRFGSWSCREGLLSEAIGRLTSATDVPRTSAVSCQEMRV